VHDSYITGVVIMGWGTGRIRSRVRIPGKPMNPDDSEKKEKSAEPKKPEIPNPEPPKPSAKVAPSSLPTSRIAASATTSAPPVRLIFVGHEPLKLYILTHLFYRLKIEVKALAARNLVALKM
jgi:hypothetical protein